MSQSPKLMKMSNIPRVRMDEVWERKQYK